MSNIKGIQQIGFKQSQEGTTYFQTYNPVAGSQTAYRIAEASEKEIEEAVQLASKASAEFANMSSAKRAHFLETIADEMQGVTEQIVQVYCEESGLPEGRANGELNRTLGQLRKYAAQARGGRIGIPRIDTADANRQPQAKPDLRKVGVPLGPVVVFGASNFPLAYSTAGGDTASAFAAGCPVIVKGHPLHAATGEIVASAIDRAAQKTGMPDGVFSHLQGQGHDLGQKLTEHQQIKAVGFTGSHAGGRALMDLASKRVEPIPVFAEMGSINPVVFLPSALQHKGQYWAEQYAASITLGVGQFCTNPGLMLAVQGEELEGFKKSLLQNLSATSPACMIHPNLAENYNKNRQFLSDVPGVEVLLYSVEGETPVQLNCIQGEDFLTQPNAQTEVFGPSSLLVECKNQEELLTVIDHLEGQLTGSMIYESKDESDLAQVQEHLGRRVGRLIHNGVPTGVEVYDAMHHGGPYPASTDARFGAVGGDAVDRWLRPLSYQNCPNDLLPAALQNENPLKLMRLVDGEYTRKAIPTNA